MAKVIELINKLQTGYQPDEEIAYAIWNRRDVLSSAESGNVKLSEAQADSVLDRVHRCATSTAGITWDLLDQHVAAVAKHAASVQKGQGQDG